MKAWLQMSFPSSGSNPWLLRLKQSPKNTSPTQLSYLPLQKNKVRNPNTSTPECPARRCNLNSIQKIAEKVAGASLSTVKANLCLLHNQISRLRRQEFLLNPKTPHWWKAAQDTFYRTARQAKIP